MIRPTLLVAALLLGNCENEPSKKGSDAAVRSEERPGSSTHKAASAPLSDLVRVRLKTAEGPILLELDAKRAPITAANFVRYVEEGRFDNTSFYRAAPTKGAPAGERGFIQGGIRRNYRKMLPPIAHEPTSETGLRHEAGTISMAHTAPGNAMGEFFITVSAMPAMDASANDPGYAAFGRVVEGLDVVQRILTSPTIPDAGRGAMRGQMLADPVSIVSAERID